MTLPVTPQLFDLLIEYGQNIEQGTVKATSSLASTSPALTFCENFYAQFFQNAIGQEITSFNRETRKAAVRLRLEIKEKKGPLTTVQLITWFEKLCDIYPNVLALGYGGGTRTAFLEFHKNYLLILLERISAWAEAENYPEIRQKAETAFGVLRKALQSIQK